MCKKNKDPHRLSISALAIMNSIFSGGYLFLSALFASMNIETWGFSNEVFTLVSSIYPGVTATITGAFIGLVWGLLCGALCGGIFGGVYNFLIDKVRFTKKI